jgi:plastocyanin
MKRIVDLLVLMVVAVFVLVACGGSGGGDGGGGGGVTTVTYSISGQVTLTGSGLSGVTITLKGVNSATATTDTSGNYTFNNLTNGAYNIWAEKPGFLFSPDFSMGIINGNITGLNFTATSAPYSISGRVTLNGSGLSGVVIGARGPGSATTLTETTTTDVSGNYTFTNIANGDYTITPTEAGFDFSPTSSHQTVSGADIIGVNFTASSTQNPYNVTCPPSGTTNITIQDFVFTPQNVTIGTNGIVKWTNNGPSVHTVTGQYLYYGNFNLQVGASTCVQFPATGTYLYFCTIHPSMAGFVTVQ